RYQLRHSPFGCPTSLTSLPGRHPPGALLPRGPAQRRLLIRVGEFVELRILVVEIDIDTVVLNRLRHRPALWPTHRTCCPFHAVTLGLTVLVGLVRELVDEPVGTVVIAVHALGPTAARRLARPPNTRRARTFQTCRATFPD